MTKSPTPATTVATLSDSALESAFVGALIIDPDEVPQVRATVMSSDLSSHECALVYEAILGLYDERQAIDYLTICDRLERSGRLDDAGGRARIASLVSAVPSSVHLPTYAEMVRRLAMLRAFVLLAEKTVRKAHEGQTTPNLLYAWIEEELQAIRLRQRSLETGVLRGIDFLPWYETLLYEREEESRSKTLKPFDWPWASWNKLVRPMRPGTMGIIVAPDGSGKSIALEMIAEFWARRGHSVLLVHLEDEMAIKADRRLARWTGIPLETLESGDLTAEQLALCKQTETTIAETWGTNLNYKHAPGHSVGEILAFAEAENALRRCDVLVIDYLNKIDADADILWRTRDDWKRDAIVIERIRTFGEKSGVPVLTAAQMNKAGKDDWKNVTRNSARGTGELSDKAQLIITFGRELAGPEGIYAKNGQLIAREGEYSPLLQVRVDKQNRGKTGLIAAQWLDGPRFRILDLAQGGT